MKKLGVLAAVLLVAVALVAVGVVKAADAKEVTLTGKIVCGKCTLKETADCSNVLIVKDGDKEVKYYIQDKGKPETYHSCKPDSSKEATVKGKVEVKDGKNLLTATEVKVK
jgi:hypothetical protein